jgi:hypothetical protein
MPKQTKHSSRTKRTRHKRFLAAGFFPEELPPPFNSRDLAKNREALQRAFEAFPQNRGEPPHLKFVSRPEVLLFPRYGKHDRRFTIMNPINYFFLSKEIADHWIEIRRHLKSSKYSISNLVFDWDGDRVFLKPNFAAKSKKLTEMSVRYSYILYSDIARFYHTIYTHALPWSLHTKELAKRTRGSTLLGNRLDTLVRNAQDGQTIGLPVGPETSRVLAELVGVAIDAEIYKREKTSSKGLIRFVDDMAVGAESFEEAERIKSVIRKAAYNLELEVNEEKTRVERVLKIDYSSWRHDIKDLLRGTGS